MADASPATKPAGKLDSLPKEELLKFIKKQANQTKDMKRKLQECMTALESEKEEVQRLEHEKKSWLSRGVSAEFEKKEKVAKKDQELKVAAHLGQQMLEEHDLLKQHIADQDDRHGQVVERLQSEIFALNTNASDLEEKLQFLQKSCDAANAEAKKCKDALESTLSEQDADQQKQVGVAKQATKKAQELKAKLKSIEHDLNSKWQLQVDQLKEEKRVMSVEILNAQTEFEERASGANSALRDEVTHLQQMNKELSEKVYTLDLAYESMSGKNEAATIQLEDKKHATQNLETELQKIRTERDKFIKSYKIVKAKGEKSAILEEELKKQLGSISSERDELQVTLRNVNKDRRNLLLSNKKMKTKLKLVAVDMEADEEMKERGTPSPKLDEDLVAQLQSRNKELHEMLEEANGRRDTLHTAKAELEQALSLGDKERRTLVEETETVKRQLENLKFELDEIQAGKQSKTEENARLLTQMNDIQEEKGVVASKVQELTREIAEITSQLQTVTAELKESTEAHARYTENTTAEVAEMKQQEAELSATIVQQNSKVMTLEETVSALADEKDQLALHHHDLQRSLDEQKQMDGMNKEELEARMCEIVEDRNAIRTAHEELELKHLKLTESLKMAEERENEFEKQSKEMSDKFKCFGDESALALKVLQDELHEAKETSLSEIALLKQEVSRLDEELQTQLTEVQNAAQERYTALQSASSLTEAVQALTLELEASHNEIARLSDHLQCAKEAHERNSAALSAEMANVKHLNSELSESVNEFTEHNEELTAKTQENRTTICKLEARIDELLKALQALNEEKMHQECEIEELFKAQDDLHYQLDERCREIKHLQEELQSNVEKYEALLHEKAELDSNVEMSIQSSAEHDTCSRQDSFTLREELTKLEEKLCVASDELSVKDSSIESLELQLAEFYQQNSNKSQEYNTEVTTMREDVTKLEEQLCVASHQLSVKDSSVESLELQLAEFQQQNSNKSQEYNTEVTTMREELTKLEEQLCAASHQLAEKNSFIESLELQLTEFQQQNSERLQKHEIKLNAAQDQLVYIEQCKDKIIDEFKVETQRLKDSFEDLNREREMLRVHVDNSSSEKAELRTQHSVNEKAHTERVQGLESCKRELENRVDELSSIHASLKESVQEFAQQNNELQLSDARMQEALCLMEAKCDAMLKELDANKEEFSTIKANLENSEQRALELNSELQKSVSKKEDLEAQLCVLTKGSSFSEEEQLEKSRELDTIKSLLKERDYVINELKEQCQMLSDKTRDLDGIENCQATKISSLQDELQSTLMQFDNIEAICKAKDEKLVKLKNVAVKAKREYDNIKSQMEQATRQFEEQHQSQHEVKSQQEETVTSLSSELEQWKMKCGQLEEDGEISRAELDKIQKDHSITSERVSHFEAEIDALTNQCENLVARLGEKEEEVTSLRTQLDTAMQDCKSKALLLEEAAKVKIEFEETKEKLSIIQKDAESLNKDSHQLKMVQLELDDFQRTIDNLQQKVNDRESLLAEKVNLLTEATEQIKMQKKEADEHQRKISQLEEKVSKFKAMIVKLKKELKEASSKEETLVRQEAEFLSCLEANQREIEGNKIILAKTAAEYEALTVQMRSAAETHEGNYISLERSLQKALNDLATTQKELESCKAEYESYKTRARTVLKQQKLKQKSNEPAVDDTERIQLEELLSTTKHQLEESRSDLALLVADQETLETEHQRLQTVHKRLETRFNDATQEWQLRIEAVETAAEAAQNGWQECVRLLTQDRTTSREAHQLEISELRRQLDTVMQRHVDTQSPGPRKDADVDGSSSDADTLDGLTLRRSSTPSKLVLPLMTQHSINLERQQGEGMEQTQLEEASDLATPVTPPSTSSQSAAGFLERILSPESLSSPVFWPNSPGESREEGLRLKTMLTASEKKMEHLTEVLRDAEANSMRQNEQVKILKDEIRRMERNKQREEALNNLEYLKNIIIKFMKCAPSEREYLVPVICTMLKLDQEEKNFVTEYAKGDSVATEDTADSSWSSYMYRWTA